MNVIATIIITDSTCDMSHEDQKRINVGVIPLTVHFGTTSYRDGVDITMDEFYDKLDKCEKLPTTSQIAPQTFADVFAMHLENGDDIVGIFISSEISGTYNSACIAKQMIGSDNIHIVDSRSATMSLALLVFEAAKQRDLGHSAKEIAEQTTVLTKKVRFFAAVNTLKYLRKGGRISAASAIIGEMLGVKPIVSIIEGKILSVGKARGMNSAINLMLQKALVDVPDKQYDAIFAHSCSPDLLEKAIETLKKPLQIVNYVTCNIGSVIGTYVGRTAVGIAYIAE